MTEAILNSKKGQPTMATIKDISRVLGISKSQVSAALRGNADVSQKTRQRVQEVAKELNYSPNLSAQKLVSGRSGMVALVVRDHENLTQDTTFIESVAGLSRAFSSRDMQFVLHISAEDEPSESTYGRLISAGALDGFVLTEPEPKDLRIAFLKSRDIPFVVHGNVGEGSDFPFFEINNFDVGYRLAQYLVASGHRKIALLNGRSGLNSAYQRQLGVDAALSEVGATRAPEFTFNARFSEAYGAESLDQLLATKDRLPTGIICGNMSIAQGVYNAVIKRGLRIPEDLSVVAHDDRLPQHDSSRFNPPLTVSASPLADSWHPLAEILVGRIKGKKLEELQVFKPIEFVERGSVLPPSAQRQ